jgi:cytochrome P450
MTTFDPFEPGQAANAWETLRELRRDGAVAPIAGGMHYVTRHPECIALLRDTDAFSNATGFKEPGTVIPLEDRILGELDPPRHGMVRRAMVTALTPKLVHAAEPFMHSAAETLLAAIADSGTADLVPALTVPFPNRVTVHLLGMPDEDADRIAAFAKGLMVSEFPRTNRTERGEGFEAAFPEFAGYIDEWITRRERESAAAGAEQPPDVLSRLLQLEVDGERLTRRTVRALVRNLITGGLTTTSQLLGNLLFQLLSTPQLDAAVRADRALLVPAIEESLRLMPPILFIPRGCVADTSIAGTEVSSGERVIAGTASANRDEGVFEDADAFRVDRPNADQHLTFGAGPHVCPGATLARTVTRVGVEAFLDRFPHNSISLADGYEFENVPTFFECGPARLPVVTQLEKS